MEDTDTCKGGIWFKTTLVKSTITNLPKKHRYTIPSTWKGNTFTVILL